MSVWQELVFVLLVIGTGAGAWFGRGLVSYLKEKHLNSEKLTLDQIKGQVIKTLEQEQLAGEILESLTEAARLTDIAIAKVSTLQIIGEKGTKIRPSIDSMESKVARLKKQFAESVQKIGLYAYAPEQPPADKADKGNGKTAKPTHGEANNTIAATISNKTKELGVSWQTFWTAIQAVEPSLRTEKFGKFCEMDVAKREAIVAAAEAHLKESANGAAVN